MSDALINPQSALDFYNTNAMAANPSNPSDNPLGWVESGARGLYGGTLDILHTAARLGNAVTHADDLQYQNRAPMPAYIDRPPLTEANNPYQEDWAEGFFSEADKDTAALMRQNEASPALRTWAGNVVYSAAHGISVGFQGAGLGLGAVGPALTMGATQGVDTYDTAREQGVDNETALGLARRAGITGAAMAFVAPAFGKTLPIRILTGAGIGVGFGAANRTLMSSYLRDRGYTDLAERYKAFDAEQMTIDAIIGGAFGLLPGHHPTTRPDPEAVTAALVHRDTLDREVAFGIPENAAARRFTGEALSRMERQAENDEPIDPGQAPEDVSFLERPHEEFAGLTPDQHLEQARQLGNDGEYGDALAHAYLAQLGGADGARDVVRMLREDASPEEQAGIMSRVAEIRRANQDAQFVEAAREQGASKPELDDLIQQLRNRDPNFDPDMLASVSRRWEDARDVARSARDQVIAGVGAGRKPGPKTKAARNEMILSLREQFGKNRQTDGGRGRNLVGSATHIVRVLRGNAPLPDGTMIAKPYPDITRSTVLSVWKRADDAARAAQIAGQDINDIANRLGIPPERVRAVSAVKREALASAAREPLGVTVDEVKAAASDLFGADWEALAKAGKVEVVQSRADVPAGSFGLPRGTQAVHFSGTGKTYFIANNIDINAMRGLVLHEIGVHHGLEDYVGARGMEEIFRQLRTMVEADHPAVVEARAFAERYTLNKNDVDEETLAYLVENHADLPLVQSILSRLRQWLVKTFGSTFGMRLTVDDLRALAVSSFRRAAVKAHRDTVGVSDPIGEIQALASQKDDTPDAGALDSGNGVTAYRGLREPFDASRDARGYPEFWTESREGASRFGDHVLQGQIDTSKFFRLNARGRAWNDIPVSALHGDMRVLVQAIKENGRHPFDPVSIDNLKRAAQRSGYAGVTVENVVDQPLNSGPRTPHTVHAVFDRSARRIAEPNTPDGGGSQIEPVWLDAGTPLYRGISGGRDPLSPGATEGWGQDGTGVSFDRHPGVASGYATSRAEFYGGDGAAVYRGYAQGRLKLVPFQNFNERVTALLRGSGHTDAERLAAAHKAQEEFSRDGYVGVSHGVASMGGGTVTGEVRLWPNANGEIPHVSTANPPARGGAAKETLPPGILREIDDSAAVATQPSKPGTYRLDQVLNHPALYDEFPELRALPVRIDASIESAGRASGDGIDINPRLLQEERGGYSFKEAVIHELQHHLDLLEGRLVQGSSPNWLRSNIRDTADPLGTHERLTSEQLAYAAQRRANMTPAERAASDPFPTSPLAYRKASFLSRLSRALHGGDTRPYELHDLPRPRVAEITTGRTPATPNGGASDFPKFSVRQNAPDRVESKAYQDRLRAVEERLAADGILRKDALGRKISARSGEPSGGRDNVAGGGESGAQKRELGRLYGQGSTEAFKVPRAIVQDVLSVSGLKLERAGTDVMGKYQAVVDVPQELSPDVAEVFDASDPAEPTRIKFDIVNNGPSKKLLLRLSSVNPAIRGSGAGKWLYRQLIDWGLEHGYEVYSDFSVSPQAQRVYEAFARMGYVIEKDPRATAKANGTLSTGARDNFAPVYRVRGGDTAEMLMAAPAPRAGYEIGGPTLKDRLQPLIEQRAREEAYNKLSPVEQALADGEVKLSVNPRKDGEDVSGRDLLDSTEVERDQAKEMKKGFDAAARCAARHGVEASIRDAAGNVTRGVVRSLPTRASFITLRATAANALPSADAAIGQILGMGAALPLGITATPLLWNESLRAAPRLDSWMQRTTAENSHPELDQPAAIATPQGAPLSDVAVPAQTMAPEPPPPIQGVIKPGQAPPAENPRPDKPTDTAGDTAELMRQFLESGRKPQEIPKQYVATGKDGAQPPGLITPGNIDLSRRPVVHNSDGTISTVRSITITDDQGRAILIPTVVGNRVVSNQEAIQHYQQTGEHLGIFQTENQADDYAEHLHEEQAREYRNRQ